MSDTPACDVCGKPGFVQAHPSAPYTGCWCPKHVPYPNPPLYSIAKWLLILAIVAVSAYQLWQRLGS